MGQTCCSTSLPFPLPSPFLINQWTRLPPTLPHTTPLWKHSLSHYIASEHFLTFPTPYTFSLSLPLLTLRHNNPYLVSSYGFINDITSDLCGCSNQYKGRIFLEVVPWRLNQLEISFPDVLHVYLQAFKGYQMLVQQIKAYFIVDQDMIGVNQNGIVKVWVNGNFARNYSETMGLRTENEMVMTVLDCIQKSTQQSTIAQQMKIFWENTNPQTFFQAIQSLSEFSKIKNVKIPERLGCLEGVKTMESRHKIVKSENTVIQQQVSVKNESEIVRTAPSVHYHRPMLRSVQSTGNLIQKHQVSRVVINNNIPIVHGASLVSQKLSQKHGTGFSSFHSMSPIHKNEVCISPKKSQQTRSQLSIRPKQAPIHINHAIKQTSTRQPNIPKPQSNISGNNHTNFRRVEDGHTENKILQIVCSSREQIQKPLMNIVLPRSTSSRDLVSARYLEQAVAVPIFLPPSKVVKTEKIELVSQIISPQSQVSPKPYQKQSLMIPNQEIIFSTPAHITTYEQKIGQVTTIYKHLQAQRQQTEQREIESRVIESRQTEHHEHHHNHQQQIDQILLPTDIKHKANLSSSGTTSFEFFGFVNVNNQTSHVENRIPETQIVVQEQSNRELNQHIRHYTKTSGYFTEYTTNPIESRLQLPSIPSESHTPFREYESIKESTIEISVNNPIPTYTYEQTRLDYAIKPYTYQSESYQAKDYTPSFAPITSSYSNTYQHKDYMDIYNVASSYSSYVPITNYQTQNYNNYNSYGDLSRYNIGSHYQELNTYTNDLVDKYTKNVDNFSSNIDTYSNPYRVSPSINLLQNYNSNTYYPTNTCMVPSYNDYSIPRYQDIKESATYSASRYDLKQTQITTNPYSSSFNPNFNNPIKTDSTNNQNFSRQQQEVRTGQKKVSVEGYNLQYLASIYIPIQGYKVTMDNEVLADLQRLRARGLMQQAVEREMERRRERF